MRKNLIGALIVVAAGAAPVHAQGVLTERNISLAMAMTIAQTALEHCRKEGDKVTVVVVDRTGMLKIMLKDDGASPHTIENAHKESIHRSDVPEPQSEPE